MTASPRLARGVQGLGTESAFAVLARARGLERHGRSVVHLEIGQPDFPTPEHVIEAATASMRRGETGYTPSAGIAEFREVIADELARSREIDVAPDRVLVANGAKLLLFLTILAVCAPGDEVIYPDPGFPIYESAIRWAGAVPVPLALHDELGFRFSLDELSGRLGKRTKLVIFNSPNNPTGGIVPADELRATAELIRESPAWVLRRESPSSPGTASALRASSIYGSHTRTRGLSSSSGSTGCGSSSPARTSSRDGRRGPSGRPLKCTRGSSVPQGVGGKTGTGSGLSQRPA